MNDSFAGYTHRPPKVPARVAKFSKCVRVRLGHRLVGHHIRAVTAELAGLAHPHPATHSSTGSKKIERISQRRNMVIW